MFSYSVHFFSVWKIVVIGEEVVDRYLMRKPWQASMLSQQQVSSALDDQLGSISDPMMPIADTWAGHVDTREIGIVEWKTENETETEPEWL